MLIYEVRIQGLISISAPEMTLNGQLTNMLLTETLQKIVPSPPVSKSRKAYGPPVWIPSGYDVVAQRYFRYAGQGIFNLPSEAVTLQFLAWFPWLRAWDPGQNPSAAELLLLYRNRVKVINVRNWSNVEATLWNVCTVTVSLPKLQDARKAVIRCILESTEACKMTAG